MIPWFAKHKEVFFIATTIIFVLGTFVGLGGYFFSCGGSRQAVAVVGSTQIPYATFLRRVNRYVDALRAKGKEVDDKTLQAIKQEMLRDMLVNQILLERARRMGVRVTDVDVARQIEATPAFSRDGRFDQQVYFQILQRAFQETPQEYERSLKEDLQVQQFKQLVYQTAKTSPLELEALYRSQHGGSLKGFDKERAEFQRKVHEERALQLINYYLRQAVSQIPIKDFLKQRESGA
jgi:peptidyl-prolyl cis-trans isomerase D